MTEGTTTTLPANDGYPGLTITCSKDYRPAFHKASARQTLAKRQGQPLVMG